VVITATSEAQIPQPDGILYGALYVGGEVVPATDALVLLARVDDFVDPVAVYRMGTNPAVGDRYVLPIPHSLSEDGVTPSPDTPARHASVRIYVLGPNGQEVLAGDTRVPAAGQALRFDLSVSSRDMIATDPLDRTSGQGCGADGGVCGATGMIVPGLMLCGLIGMRTRARR
jgi:hypothetical protein